jgi:SIR2-like domain
MELTSLNTLTADGLNTLLEPGGSFNIILGSGISRWGPNPRRADSRGEIPTGQDISKAIVHTLFSVPPTPNAEDMDTVKRLLKEFPFEAIFDCCPDINKAENLARTLCSGAVANPVHHAFASLASAGVVKSIVTTNYDMGLDDALQYFGNPIVKIVDPPVIIPVRAYFKIHGSVDSDSPLVINLRREGMMSLPKRRVLQSLLNGVPLLVLGYSGLDFEVCPEIASARPKRVVWNFFSEEDVHLSPGLKRLEDAGMEIHILVGDMRRILQLLGYPVELNDVSSRVSEVCSLLEENFSPNERLTWRATVLNFIGYARLARVALTSLIEPTRVDLARCFFHEGRYRKSTKEYLKASRLASDDRLRRLALVELPMPHDALGRGDGPRI